MDKDKRPAIIRLIKSGMKISNVARRLVMPVRTVRAIVKRYRDTGSTDDSPRSGRPKSVCTPEIVKKIREKIRRNPHRSMRKLAREHKISDRSVRRIVNNKLKLYPYKIQKVQNLTEQAKRNRVVKSNALLDRLENGTLLKTLWTDEKLFTVEQVVNKQNDRILASSLPGASDRAIKRSSHPASVMVWGGVTARYKTPLVFVNPGVKINKEYYIDSILESVVKPWAIRTFKKRKWLFQQDGAPAHTAKLTQQWFENNAVDFIRKEEWPGYSPDLNPMDFAIWGYLESKACATPHRNLNSLQSALIREWNKIPLKMLRATVESVPKRLKACIEADGDIFEI